MSKSYKTIKLGNRADMSSMSKLKEDLVSAALSDDEGSENGDSFDNEDDLNFDKMIADFRMDQMQMALQEPQGPPPLTLEEQIEKRKMINKANAWRRKFKKKLPEFQKMDLENMSMEEIDRTIQEMSFQVGTENSGRFFEMGFQGSIYMIEQLSPYLNLKLQGLSACLMAQEETQDILNEIALLNQEYIYQAPEVRLLTLTAMTMRQVHQANKTNEVMTGFLDDKAKKDVIEKFREL